MKFSFDKFSNKKEESKPKENSELTQEQFDEQIMQEAEKLNLNLEQLKDEINQFGGVERFKAYFEEGDESNNRAGTELTGLSVQKEYHEKDAKKKALWGKVWALGTVLAELGIGAAISGRDDGNGLLYFQAFAAAIAGGAMTYERISSAIKERVKARGKENKIKKETLKFKMAGVEPK